MTAWAEHRYAVVDVEGNGHQPPDLVELAVVPVERGVIGEPVTWLFQPEQPITAMARRIHGISNDMVQGAPVFASRATEVQARLDGAVLVAHNASVDLGVLKRKLPGFAPDQVLDTLRLSRRLLPDQPNHRLGSLVSALHLGRDLPPGLRPHRADYDALVTARLFVYLANSAASMPLSFEALRGDPGGSDALF
ncbi:MAG TPA: exonuclease domain-containing protein [Streptosporangiaceae bacterium]|nr:exonuclease domain-containing protein [Streptosporangiaceae bacterium]